MRSYLIIYDIEDNKRRNKIFKLLKRYATHAQYSVFHALVKEEDIIRIKNDIKKIINKEEDSVMIVELCLRCANTIEYYGKKIEIYGEGDIMI